MQDFVSIGEASKILGVSERTLRNWDRSGLLVAHKTEGGHRRYRASELRSRSVKQDEVEPSVLEKMRQADMIVDQKKLTDNMLEFWRGEGVSDRSLAVLLNNQVTYLSSLDGGDGLTLRGKDYIVPLVKQFWEKLKCRKWVAVTAMSGPIGHHYYFTITDDRFILYQEAIVAQTRKISRDLIDVSDNDKKQYKVFTPDLTSLTETDPFINNAARLDWEEVVDINSRRIAEDVDREVLSDLMAFAPVKSVPVEEVKGYDYVITNPDGVKILDKVWGDTRSMDVFDNGQEDAFLFGTYSINNVGSWYCYSIYMLLATHPIVMNPQFPKPTALMRYHKFTHPDFSKKFMKVYF